MFGISGEHLLILGIILLIFGPRRLPELGNTLGKCVRNFKDALAGIQEADYKKLGEKHDDGHHVKPGSQAGAERPESVESSDPSKKV